MRGMTNQTATVPTPATAQGIAPADLMAHERCDRCGAHACVLLGIPVCDEATGKTAEKPLGLCAHHFRQNEDGLTAKVPGLRVIVDIREKLAARETAVHA